MKKLLTILLVLISFSTFAQFEAGEYINSDTVKKNGVNLYLEHLKLTPQNNGKIARQQGNSVVWGKELDSVYLDETDTSGILDKDNFFWSANKKYELITPHIGGGTGDNVYMTNVNSDISGYKKTSYTNDTGITSFSAIAIADTVLVQQFLFDGQLSTSILDAGGWIVRTYCNVSSIAGVSKFKYEFFVYDDADSTIFSFYSDEINNTAFQYNEYTSFQSAFNLGKSTYRLGVRVYFLTTLAASITGTFRVGDGETSYINTPIALRHERLRDKNGEENYLHINRNDQNAIDQYKIDSSKYVTYANNSSDLDLGANSISTDAVKIDGVPLLLNTFKQGNLGGAGNIFYSTGASSQPASGSLNQVIGGNTLISGYFPYWDGSKLANSGMYSTIYGKFNLVGQTGISYGYDFDSYFQYGLKFQSRNASAGSIVFSDDGNIICENLEGLTTRLITASSTGQLGASIISESGSVATIAGTISATNLTDGYIPYHISDASGLANSPIHSDGTDVFTRNSIGLVATDGSIYGTIKAIPRYGSLSNIPASIGFIRDNADGLGGEGAIVFKTGIDTPTPAERMRISSNGNVGIGFTNPLSKTAINGGLHVGGDGDAGDNNILADGTITGTQLISNTPTGTPPLVVASSTKVDSLNVDLLDGKHASDFETANVNIQRHITNDNDTIIGNEYQNLSNSKTGNNVTVNISNGTGTTFSVADADSSTTNEIQDLSRSNDTLYLSLDATPVTLNDFQKDSDTLTWDATKKDLADSTKYLKENAIGTISISVSGERLALNRTKVIGGTPVSDLIQRVTVDHDGLMTKDMLKRLTDTVPRLRGSELNYLQKVTGTNTLGNSSIIDNGSAVSIGLPIQNYNKLQSIGNIAAVGASESVASEIGAQTYNYWNAPTYTGSLLRQYGSGATGTVAGISSKNLGVLIFQNTDTSYIYTNGLSPIVTGVHSTPVNILNLDGNSGFGTLTPAARIHSESTGTQARLGYDANKYTDLSTESTGNLTIDPTGDTVKVVGAVNSTGGFFKNGVEITGGGGINYIGMTMPTGLSVSPASLTENGTFTISYQPGYTYFTDTERLNYSNAYTYRLTGASGTSPLTLSLSANHLTGSLSSQLTSIGTLANSAGLLYNNGAGSFSYKTAPSGTIVGTSDSQALTNKSVNGVTLSTGAGATNFLAGDGTYKAVSGSSKWTADTYGINYQSGNVGIGTASHSTSKLYVNGSITNNGSDRAALDLTWSNGESTIVSYNTGGGDGLYANSNGVGVRGVSSTTFGGLFEGLGCKATKYYVSSLNTAPTSSTDTGTTGEIRFTADYIYVCVATNTWKRTQISTW